LPAPIEYGCDLRRDNGTNIILGVQREKKSITAPIGHGSHVASIAAGRNGGALSSAFKATIVSVKTAGSGTTIARGMAAFNDVLEEHNHYINFPV
jgi:hypothetical protein